MLFLTNAHDGGLHGLLHQGFLHGLSKLVQIVHPVDAVHVLDERHQVAVHLHQHVGIAQRHQLTQQREGAGALRLLNLEQHHAAIHLQGNLVLARTGNQVGPGKLLLERAAVHVGMAGDGKTAFEETHNHGVCYAEHIFHAGRAFGSHQVQGRMHIQNTVKEPAGVMIQPLREHARGKGGGLPVFWHQAGAGGIHQPQGDG